MALWKPDPTFYPSPRDAAAAPPEKLAYVAAFRAEGRDVFVHCFGGASRTGLVLRGWLRRNEGLSAQEATRRAQQLWP
ncbi:MAG: ADP-ribosyl-[dinitrogen reductase] hydrolase, partial [Frankiaceae bacterium]|nr:ADP-ribosyl-[dinitrogen reductase] hydrolase [Frankiaceae bacterium]